MKSLLDNWFFQIFLLLILAFAIRTFFYGLYQVPTGSMETTILVGDRFLADKLSVWFSPPKRGEIIAFNDPTYKYSKNLLRNIFERYVYGPSNWTKRVIGVPGDNIKGTIEDGKAFIYLNGKKLSEPYKNKHPLVIVRNAFDKRSGGQRDDLRSFDATYGFKNQPFYRLDESKIVKFQNSPRLIYPENSIVQDVFDIKLGKNEYWVMGDNRLGSFDSRFFGKLDGTLIHGRIIFRIWSFDSAESWWIMALIKKPLDFFRRIRWERCLQKVK